MSSADIVKQLVRKKKKKGLIFIKDLLCAKHCNRYFISLHLSVPSSLLCHKYMIENKREISPKVTCGRIGKKGKKDKDFKHSHM